MPHATKGKKNEYLRKRRAEQKAEALKMARRQEQVRKAKKTQAVMNLGRKTIGFFGHESHFNTILTEKVASVIVGYVLEGNYPDVACQAAGVSQRAFRYWKARAEEFTDTPIEDIPSEERIFVDLFHVMAIAEAQAEVALLRRVAEGKLGWQSSMTILERRHPERWRRRDTVEHEGGDPSKPIRTITIPTDDERAKEVAQILKTADAVQKNGSRNGKE